MTEADAKLYREVARILERYRALLTEPDSPARRHTERVIAQFSRRKLAA